MNANKEFWERVKKTDPKRVKPITGKQYKGNSPQPYYMVERMTEEFGMCGIGWGINILNERMERLTDTDVLHVAVVELWYVHGDKNGSITQVGQTKATYKKNDGGIMVDEDAPKKSVTDAITKCMSYLGFAGDIFSGQWDDSKYVQELKAEFAEPEVTAEQIYVELNKAAAKGNAALTGAIKKTKAEYLNLLSNAQKKALRDAAVLIDEQIASQA